MNIFNLTLEILIEKLNSIRICQPKAINKTKQIDLQRILCKQSLNDGFIRARRSCRFSLFFAEVVLVELIYVDFAEGRTPRVLRHVGQICFYLAKRELSKRQKPHPRRTAESSVYRHFDSWFSIANIIFFFIKLVQA